jgi:putative acetyltransferase
MVIYRKIQKSDNEKIRDVIRTVLEEYGGKRSGTAYYDKDTDNMFDAYDKKNAVYYVAEVDGIIAGGCGVQHLSNTDKNIAELQKLYLLPKFRNLGIGKKLVELCISDARKFGFDSVYLETFSNMHEAQNLYLKFDFEYLDYQLGGTGHSSCDVWMLKNLK